MVPGVSPDVIQKQPAPSPDWASINIPASGGKRAIPRPIVSDGKNTMWVGLTGYNAIASVAMGQNVHVYPISSNVGSLVVGPDHNVWVTGSNDYVAQVAPGGVETDFSLGSGSYATGGITVGPDGALWFPAGTSLDSGVGRMTTAGVYSYFSTGSVGFNGITTGPDGNLWLTDSCCGGNGSIYRMTTSGTATAFPVTGVPTFITSGPDGALWFVEPGDRQSHVPPAVGRITTSGSLSYFPNSNFAFLGQIVRGAGSSMWLTYESGIVGFNTTTDTFSAPIERGSYAMQGWLAYGPDRNVWATAGDSGVLTYIRLAMTVTPSSLTIPGTGQGQSLSVTESNYNSTWSAASSKTSIATVSQTSKGNFMVMGVAPGTCTVTISDTAKNMVRVPVTVQ